MAIISAKAITPKAIRNILPDQYKGKPYVSVKAGDKFTITDCVFSVYQAKRNGEYLTTKTGDPIVNTTVYIGLDDGSYTSLKGNTVIGQLIALTGFDKENEIGQFAFSFEPEKVQAITVEEQIGTKKFDYIAFENA